MEIVAELNYKSLGSGPCILILHGLFGSLDNFQSIAKALSNSYQVITLDLRNHGRSPHTDNFSYTAMANDIYHLWKKLDLPPVYLIGHSMGGKVVCQILNLFEEMTTKCIVIDIAPKKYPATHDEIFKAMSSLPLHKIQSRDEADSYLKAFIPEISVRQFILKNLEREKDNSFHWKINLPGLQNQYDEILKSVYPNHLISIPILFVKGEKSNYIHFVDEIDIKNSFSNAQFFEIKNVGHWVHAEDPKSLLELIYNYLK